jgi:hypothetical protein
VEKAVIACPKVLSQHKLGGVKHTSSNSNTQKKKTALADHWRSYAFRRPEPINTLTAHNRNHELKNDHNLNRISLHLAQHSRTQLNRTLVIRIANDPNRLGPSGKFVENSTKISFFEITGYRIKYSTVLWLLELQIRRGRIV